MELEFDKEMDALLRKARSDISVEAPKGGHLDADAMAAFAENAIPGTTRSVYTAHLADCDSCRKALSQVALLNEPVVMKAVAAAAPASAANIRASAPWYRALFRTPGLAAAFGVLVLAFGGVLVYLVTQRGANTSATVAMDANKASNAAIPFSGIDSNSSSNANAAASAVGNVTVSNTAANASRPAANSSSNASSTAATTNESSGTATGAGSAPSGTTAAPPPVAAAPAPKPVDSLDARATVAEDKAKTATEEHAKDENEKETARDRSLRDDSLARGQAANRKAAGGPLRSAGPVQNQVQNNAQASEMAVTRKLGGKTFHNSNGAWYDSAYHGQSTTNVHRGTDDFKKLDPGLRSIANDLGGVVVVVWKDKAYRIQ